MRPVPPRRPRFARLALAVLLPALAGTAGGCAILGAIAYKTSGAPTIKAQYAPPKEPMVVFVQREQNPADASRASDRIARLVTDDLKAHNVGPMTDPGAVTDLQGRRTGSSVWASRLDAAATRPTTQPQPRTVAEVGRAVGASQVLYVDLVTFSVEPAMATEMVNGRIEARVRVVDAETGQTRWPTDTTQGYTVTAGTPYAKPGMPVDDATIREQMCLDLAAKVGRLFYDWKSEGADTGTPTE